MLSCKLGNGPNHQGSFFKKISCSEGDHVLEGGLHAIIDKKTNMFQISKKRNGKWNVNDNMINK